MVSFTDILFLMGLGFSLAAPLGPVNMEMIKQSLRSKYGFVLGMFTGFGAMTGDFLVATTVLFVGSVYLQSIITIVPVYVMLLIFNVFILGFIGISALRAPPPKAITVGPVSEVPSKKYGSLDGVEPEATDEGHTIKNNSILKQMSLGLGIVVSSPWSYFWWASFGGYIINSGLPLQTNQERFIVTLFFLAGIFTWVILFCGLLGVSRHMASPKVLNYITKSTAVIILLFAVKISYDGIVFLIKL